MKALSQAAHAIASATSTTVGDSYDWGSIADSLERGYNESAATAFRLMDTYSRDLLNDAARADADVKQQASDALSIQWLF